MVKQAKQLLFFSPSNINTAAPTFYPSKTGLILYRNDAFRNTQDITLTNKGGAYCFEYANSNKIYQNIYYQSILQDVKYAKLTTLSLPDGESVLAPTMLDPHMMYKSSTGISDDDPVLSTFKQSFDSRIAGGWVGLRFLKHTEFEDGDEEEYTPWIDTDPTIIEDFSDSISVYPSYACCMSSNYIYICYIAEEYPSVYLRLARYQHASSLVILDSLELSSTFGQYKVMAMSDSAVYVINCTTDVYDDPTGSTIYAYPYSGSGIGSLSWSQSSGAFLPLNKDSEAIGSGVLYRGVDDYIYFAESSGVSSICRANYMMKARDGYLYFNNYLSGANRVFCKTNSTGSSVIWETALTGTGYDISNSQIIHKSYGSALTYTVVLYDTSTETIYLFDDSDGSFMTAIDGVPYYADSFYIYYRIATPTGDDRFKYQKWNLINDMISIGDFPQTMDIQIPSVYDFRQKNFSSIELDTYNMNYFLGFGTGITGENTTSLTPLYLTGLTIEKVQDGADGQERIKFTLQWNEAIADISLPIYIYKSSTETITTVSDEYGESIGYSSYFVSSQTHVRYELGFTYASQTSVPDGYIYDSTLNECDNVGTVLLNGIDNYTGDWDGNEIVWESKGASRLWLSVDYSSFPVLANKLKIVFAPDPLEPSVLETYETDWQVTRDFYISNDLIAFPCDVTVYSKNPFTEVIKTADVYTVN